MTYFRRSSVSFAPPLAHRVLAKFGFTEEPFEHVVAEQEPQLDRPDDELGNLGFGQIAPDPR